ncbi:hypothetical protein, partial [Escherichia coli]|uniref:hypothetical protein n=1 Tax=Escherichia coli TaxID=562 RepID=UPI001AEBA69E
LQPVAHPQGGGAGEPEDSGGDRAQNVRQRRPARAGLPDPARLVGTILDGSFTILRDDGEGPGNRPRFLRFRARPCGVS